MKPKIYIGIDPGKEGGVSWIDESGDVYYEPMPETEKDVFELFVREFYDTSPLFQPIACIEWINTAIPKVSKSSMSKLYGSYMMLRAFLISNEIPMEAVKPRDWQKSFGISPKGKNESTYRWKCRLSATAQEIYPKLLIWKETKKKQLLVSDAILIATYCKRKMEGIL